ncbi:rhomboid family intramembrane serine protease [Latilactobacillus graminis]|uniref:Rhomboid family protein n=2 Tax=Latilactobacillus graminis TaxID=60519 RepID=A0AA89I6F3_9LACO|nr:rhomboid family intramembrane serine protease [Latilactobacillus graminis]KRM21174.1 rhomboid family protein [Latilactobacillus graminis DSM 20719]QFP79302.1 rhomboid family intramembrane serine protease [Latilactobacillus graminis]
MTNFKERWQDIPFVTYALMLLNILMFVTLFLRPSLWLNGFISVKALLNGHIIGFIMASVNHGRFLNLLMDLIILYFVGGQLERLLGHWRLLAVYFLSSLASLFTASAFLGINTPTVMAGTAMLGVFGGFLMLGDAFKEEAVFGQIARQYWVFLFLTIGLQFIVNHNALYAMVGGVLGGFLSSMALGAPKVGRINPLNRAVSGLIYVGTLILFGFLGMNH